MIHRYLKTSFWFGLVSLVTLLAGAQVASAQYGGSMANMYNTISFASQSLSISQNSYYNTLHQGQKLGSGSSGSSNTPSYNNTPSNTNYPSNTGPTYQPPPPPPQYPITATDFTPASPNRILPDQFVNEMPNLPSDQKEALRNAYVQTLTLFESRARKNNLANSFAFMVATSQQIVSQKAVLADEFARMANYFNNTIASAPQYRNYSDQQKQILYESLILTAASMDALYTKGGMENNPAAQQQARDMAKSYLKSLAGINVP